jgi:hypothetical protein
MRFFTMEWWSGAQEEADGVERDAAADYQQHLATLRPFPREVAQLDALPSLHDAHLRRLHQEGDGKVALHFDALLADGTRGPLEVSYGDVESFEITGDPEEGLPGPYGFGDMGYDEIDSVVGGAFEHRLLFSSGIEMCVRFRSFRFGGSAVQQGVAADGASPRR